MKIFSIISFIVSFILSGFWLIQFGLGIAHQDDYTIIWSGVMLVMMIGACIIDYYNLKD